MFEQRHLVVVWMPVLCLDIIAMLTQHELCYIFSMHSYNSADLLQRRVSNIISFRILNLKISLMMKPAEDVISTPPRDLSRPSVHPSTYAYSSTVLHLSKMAFFKAS